MKILITCGPSYEPIDGARRMTNFSTGKLGVTLANYFARSGHDVICVKGEGSSCSDACAANRVEFFGTNDSLAGRLQTIAIEESIDVVFHAAALCDYRVEQVLSATGETLASPKYSTRDGRLHLVLAPALKILPSIRGWFPAARIVGWKYELAGPRDDAFAKAWKQLRECGIDACVLNGAAYGEGFALCDRGGQVRTCANSENLCIALADLIHREVKLEVA
jgi:phosphopantothenate---cysteine ligase (CTP)